MVTNNETPHVIDTVRDYLAGGGQAPVDRAAQRPLVPQHARDH